MNSLGFRFSFSCTFKIGFKISCTFRFRLPTNSDHDLTSYIFSNELEIRRYSQFLYLFLFASESGELVDSFISAHGAVHVEADTVGRSPEDAGEVLFVVVQVHLGGGQVTVSDRRTDDRRGERLLQLLNRLGRLAAEWTVEWRADVLT